MEKWLELLSLAKRAIDFKGVKCYISRYEQARISHIGISTRKCVSESNRLAERVYAKRDIELIENKGCACSSEDRARDS